MCVCVLGGADGRGEELSAVAEDIYRGRLKEKRGGDAASDWAAAQVGGGKWHLEACHQIHTDSTKGIEETLYYGI